MAIGLPQPDAQSALIARFAHGLLRIQDEVQKHLHQLVRIAGDLWKTFFRQKVHRNVVLAQRVGVQVQGALYQFAQIDRSSCPGAGGREKYIRFCTISAARRAC